MLVFALQSVDLVRPLYLLSKRLWHQVFSRNLKSGSTEEGETSRLVQSPSSSIDQDENEEDFKVAHFDFLHHHTSNRHRRENSVDTLNNDTSPRKLSLVSSRKVSIRQKLVNFAFGAKSFLEGGVLVLSWIGLLTGIILYTGKYLLYFNIDTLLF